MAQMLWSFLLIPLFSTVFPECDIGGTWSTWRLSTNQSGYDYCGACWMANWFRDCLSAPECPCDGPAQFSAEMNTGPCRNSPRDPCCPGYNLSYTNLCDTSPSIYSKKPPIAKAPGPNDTYCPPSGVGIWGPWGDWGGCSLSCGQFGIRTRIRTCLSDKYGCPCYAADVGPCQSVPCPETPCPEAPFCKGPLATSSDGLVTYCYPFETTLPIGSWTEWTPVAGAVCNDTCGMYGWIDSKRFCFPAGGVCEGTEYRSYQPCPATPICINTRPSCKQGYDKIIGNRAYECRLQ